MSKSRRLSAVAAGIVAVAILAAGAFADHQLSNFPGDKASAPDLPAAALDHGAEAEAVEVEPLQVENGEADNHGQCVSKAAQFDQEGLAGFRKGLFVSLVARDGDMVGDDCDQDPKWAEYLDEALNASDRGKPESVGPGAGASDNGQGASATTGKGRDFGQSNKDDHAPGS